MPSALHPQAKFDPIPPNLDLQDLVEKTPNLSWVTRISTARVRTLSTADFERLVLKHVIENGRPLVIEGWNRALPRSLFSSDWLEEHYNKKQENVRDITGQTDIPMTMGHYLRSMKQLTNQWTPTNFRDERRQRLYLKDIDCPPEWHDHLRKVIPASLFYMNSNVEEKANIAASRRNNNGLDMFDDDMPEKTAAIAGDLMSSLPEEMRAQNLMCYIGHEGTYTPAHREMCASLGQNIMVEASGSENGEKPGSSIWFMTESKDREVVREYFLSMLGHDIEIEKHFAQINAWKKANFPVYVVEQKVGDFILIPPLAPHQVWNRGTRTMKVAWNRTTAQTLRMALYEALPKARLVCRDEQYKNKAIIYYTLKKYARDLASMDETADNGWLGLGQDLVQNSPRMKEIARDFKTLFQLYTEILVDEMFAFKEKEVDYVEFDSCVTCSYCRCNIFNRFLTCKHCIRLFINGEEDTYDICMECYAMGRSCVCTSNLHWCEQFPWSQLVEDHETWRNLIIKNDGFVDINSSPQPLELARRLAGKKSVAEICQEQLKRRPFKDITKVEQEAEAESSGPELNDEGRPKKKKRKNQRKVKKGETDRCHVCCHREYMYKLQHCSTLGCNEAYCYGVLYRAFDMMPQAVMETENWICPKCQKICNCASCRRAGTTTPYQPKNTLLGHDTRPIADDRSIEALVDFRVHNLSWLKVVGEESRNKNSKRMQRLQAQAEAEKAKDNSGLEDALGEEEDMTADQLATLQSSLDSGSFGPALANGRAEGEADAPQDEEESVYPDPTGMGGRERMLGLGYYQQDDSPDKILFDPYQMPTAEALEEPQVSEYIKKTLRAAKRKARQETEDDPDFQGPRSWKRAKKTEHPPDLLDHVDPNMSNEPAAPEAAVAPGPVAEIPAAADPNGPYNIKLRNAQPIASYVEAEEPLMEELEEAVVDPIALLAQLDAGFADQAIIEANAGRNHLDIAADAIRSIAGGDKPEAQTTPKAKKKGGRPRDRPDGTLRVHSDRRDWFPAVPVQESKPKARMTRASLVAEGLTEEEVEEKLRELNHQNHDELDEVNEHVDIDELEAEIQRQLAADNDNSESHLSVVSDDPRDKSFRRASGARGRPRGSYRLRGTGRLRRSDIGPSQPPSQKSTPLESGKRGRGRPPKNRHSEGVQQRSSPTKEAPQKMLSMAERMALKGKRFKIGQRRTRSSVTASGFTAVNKPMSTTTGTETGTSAPVLDDMLEPKPQTEPEMSVQREQPKEAAPGSPAAGDEDVSMRLPSPASEPVHSPNVENHAPSLLPSTADDEGHDNEDDHHSQHTWTLSPSPEVFHGRTTFPIPSSPPHIQDPESESGKDSSRSSPAAMPSPPKRSGPTIVRLGTESEEEEEEDYHMPHLYGGVRSRSPSGSISNFGGSTAMAGGRSPGGGNVNASSDTASSDSDDDDEGIPSKKRGPGRPPGAATVSLRGAVATRGRGRGRGRGRPPGRGARRGRGRAR